MPDEPAGAPVFTAADMLAYRRRLGRAPAFPPPSAAILCFQHSTLAYAARRYGGKKAGGFYGRIYRLKKEAEGIVALGEFGLGAPALAVLVEELAAFGTNRFISIGLAGGIQTATQEGELVVAAAAIGDDGVSPHYLGESGATIQASGLAQRFAHSLQQAGHSYQLGTSWTTSAPYREGRRQLARLQQAGVLAVEMEAAALYAVAQVVQAEACAAFAISDSLAGGIWRPGPNIRLQEERLRHLVDAAVATLKA